MKDLEKRKEAYGICGECNEPGTGVLWCQPCNAKRIKENFKNCYLYLLKILISLIFIRLSLIFSFISLVLYHALE